MQSTVEVSTVQGHSDIGEFYASSLLWFERCFCGHFAELGTSFFFNVDRMEKIPDIKIIPMEFQ